MDVTRDTFEAAIDALEAAVADPHFAFWRCARARAPLPPSIRARGDSDRIVLFFSHAVVRTHCINTNQTLLSQEKRKEDYANRLAPRSPSSGANDDESPPS